MCTVDSSYINDNYDKFKCLLMAEWRKYSKMQFNEDIFHDTLLKCIERFSNETDKTDNDFKAYLVAAFKNNIFRDGAYHRNMKNVDMEVNSFKIPVNLTSNLDIDLIIKSIEKVFDKTYALQFEDWINGSTIQQINQKYNCTNARYNIDRMLKFCKKNFYNELK